MTRTGKIARLPRAVREELNCRLLDGETGPCLVAWLNGLAEVQAMLAAHFGGKAIRVQNISEWRSGGFDDWCRRRDTLALAMMMGEEADDFEALANGTRLADRFAQATAVALMGQLRAAGAMEEGPAKLRAVLKVVAGFVRLRGSDRQWERSVREGELHDCALRGRELGKMDVDGVNARAGEEEEEEEAQSNRLAPNPTKSDQIRPHEIGLPNRIGVVPTEHTEDTEKKTGAVTRPAEGGSSAPVSYPYPVEFGYLQQAHGVGPDLRAGRGAKVLFVGEGPDGCLGETSLLLNLLAARSEIGPCPRSFHGEGLKQAA